MMSGIITEDRSWRSPYGLHYSEEEIAVPGIAYSILVRIVRWT
jgi:hypothetical protein